MLRFDATNLDKYFMSKLCIIFAMWDESEVLAAGACPSSITVAIITATMQVLFVAYLIRLGYAGPDVGGVAPFLLIVIERAVPSPIEVAV